MIHTKYLEEVFKDGGEEQLKEKVKKSLDLLVKHQFEISKIEKLKVLGYEN